MEKNNLSNLIEDFQCDRSDIPHISISFRFRRLVLGSEIVNTLKNAFSDTGGSMCPFYQEEDKIGVRGKYPYENVAVRPDHKSFHFDQDKLYDGARVEHTSWSDGWFKEDNPHLPRYRQEVDKMVDYLVGKLA